MNRLVSPEKRSAKSHWHAPLDMTWRFWLAVVIGVPLLSLVVLSSLYTLRASIPPFDQLQRSEGVLAWEKISVRGGDRTLLHKSDGSVEKFSCRDGDGRLHTCFNRELAGRNVVIWWSPMEINPWQTDRHVVQMVNDEEIIISREQMTRKLETAKLFSIGTSLFVLIIFFVFIVIEYHRARRLHATEHN